MYPKLGERQIARIRKHGRTSTVHDGEVLVQAGESNALFFVITRGRVEIMQKSRGTETVVIVHGPGDFTGEINMLSNRRSLVQARAVEASEVIALDHDQLMEVIQTDPEISELLLRAFILRRVELISRGLGDVVLVGSNFDAGTLRIKDFLGRNGHPYAYIDLDRDEDAQQLLDSFRISHSEVPVVICQDQVVLRNPTNGQIAEYLELNEEIDPGDIKDVIVIGAGPAGLAAAVYAASEGLDVLVLERGAPGGQSGSSSKIENYLGFPTGISGQALSARAYTQAQKFGARIMTAKGATGIAGHQPPYAVLLDGGESVPAFSVVIASGADYRKPDITNLQQFEGSGVYFAATFIESQLCENADVAVVGAGNSAGQAAVFLARSAKRVHLIVRSDELVNSMSRYLVRRIEEHPAVTVHVNTEITDLSGNGHLAQVRWKNRKNGDTTTSDIRHVFIMTGAVPATGWLGKRVALDEKGFIRTGNSLSIDALKLAGWPLAREPFLLETSLPGVFAVGDVRSGNIKRVASAVGEGSIVVSFVHQILAG